MSFLPVDSEGRVSAADIAALWRPETCLVSVVWVNNETGVIQELDPIAALVARKGGCLHIDAAQAWGKLPSERLDLSRLGAQLVSFSGHKIGALGGTGLLWVARGVRLQALLPGKQEKGRRAGTENLLGLISLGAAARGLGAGAGSVESWIARVLPLRQKLEQAILHRVPGARINGSGAPRVANTLSLSFEGVEGDALVMALDLAGYSVASGSACSSGALEPSHVLMAMGRSAPEAMAAVRVSLADELAWETLEGFVIALEKIVARVRKAREAQAFQAPKPLAALSSSGESRVPTASF